MKVFLQHKQLHGELKAQVIEVLERDRRNYPYEVIAELAILYATEMDETYKEQFFSKFLNKFSVDVPFLKEETMYKILWSFIKAGRLTVQEDLYEWVTVKEAIIKRVPEMSPKVLTNILVLSTMARDNDAATSKESGILDFWEAVEPTLTMKIRDMDLEDLLNLMWSAIEVE